MKNLGEQIRRVGVIVNSQKRSCAGVVRRAAQVITQAGRTLYSDPSTARLAKLDATVLPDAAQLSRRTDLLLVLGGDGTMLRVASEIAGSRTPMLGINIGGLGFLTAVPSDQMASALERVWRGEFSFESRLLLEATGQFNGRAFRQTALNDIVISRGVAPRLIELDVRVNGDALTRYRCDGIIASSPTGSTAYSLAAGGAVLFPTAEVFALTPICPHTLSNRALILPSTATLDVKVISPKPATILSIDGQVAREMATNDNVLIRRSQRTVRLMHLAGSSFCETLRLKLYWRGTTL